MKQFGLDENDVDAVHQALINGDYALKSSSNSWKSKRRVVVLKNIMREN
jgi:hypothetical protein